MRALGLISCAILLAALAGYATAGSLQLSAAAGGAAALVLAATPR